MKDSTLITVSVISVILLLLIGCGLVAFMFASDWLAQEEPEPPEEEPAEEPSAPDGGEPGGEEPAAPSAEDLERWSRITLSNVEDGCLRVAKEEAGDNAGLVYGCSCEETSSSGRKTYGCEIDTADPFTQYFANIDCFLADASCSVETNFGLMTLTFEEMDEWYG